MINTRIFARVLKSGNPHAQFVMIMQVHELDRFFFHEVIMDESGSVFATRALPFADLVDALSENAMFGRARSEEPIEDRTK